MKVYGSITELVSIVLRKVAKTITISPSTQTGNPTVNIPDLGDSSSHDMVLADTTQTLTNKTLTSPKVNENVALTTTATKLNYLTSAAGTTGTTSTNIVFSTSPSLTTPTLGVASATSVNKVAITAPATSATLTLADGSTLATSGAYSQTLTATGATNVTLPTTGMLATLAGSETFTNKTLTSPTINTGTLATPTVTTGGVTLQQISTPSSPSSGYNTIYPKTDGLLYKLDSSGNEVLVGSGAGSGEINIVINPDGDTALDGGRTNDVGDWIDSGTGTTSSRTTTAGDIPLSPTKTNAIKILNDGSSTGYTYMRMTLPQSLYNRKLKISWEQFVSTSTAYVAGDFKVELYSNASSNYGGAYTAIALSTDSSGVSSIPALTGKYQTTFDSSTAPYLELRITRTAGTANSYIALNSVTVGPGIQPQGAAVTSLGAVTVTPNSGAFGTVTGNSWFANRVGQYIHLTGSFVCGTTAGGNASLTLPYSLDTTNITASVTTLGRGTYGNITGDDLLVYYKSGDASNVVRLSRANNSTTIADYSGSSLVASNLMVSLVLSFPVAEWAGSGTVNLAQNDVEYASNSSSGTAAGDTTSFAYGPSGNLIRDITATLNRRVRFQTPIQATDVLLLQFSKDQLRWTTVGGAVDTDGVDTLRDDGSNQIGAGFDQTSSIASTDIDVRFGKYRTGTSTTWTAVSTYYWRVVKAKAGAAVGFGLANTTDYQAGLVRLPNGMVRLHTGNGFGSTNTKIRRFTTAVTNTGTAITYSDSASNGAAFTINEAGIYSVSYCDNFNSAGEQIGVSLNSSQLTTNISGITEADRLGYTVSGADVSNNYSWTGRLAAGDVIRAHTTGGTVGSVQAAVNFTITQLQRF